MNNRKNHLCIGVAFYNHEKQLSSNKSMLNGLLNQKLENIQHTIIFADDCSTDNTRKILDDFIRKNKQLNIIKKYAKSNLGYSENRNVIMNSIPKNATHFFCADGDDYMENDFILQAFSYMLNKSLDFLLVPVSFANRTPFKKYEWHAIKNWKKLVLSKKDKLSRKSILKNHWLSAPWPFMIKLGKIKIKDLIYIHNGSYTDFYVWFPLQILAITGELKADKLSSNDNKPSYIYFPDGYTTRQEALNEKKFHHIIVITESTIKKIKNKNIAKKFFYLVLSNQFYFRRKDFDSIEGYKYYQRERRNFITRNKLSRIKMFINKGWKIYVSRILRFFKIIRRPA